MVDVVRQPLRVLIVDDDARVRESVREIVRATPGWECVGCLPSANDMVRAIVTAQPDVVLLDFNMPGRNVIEAIVEICQYRTHPARIIVLSATEERWAVETALAVGARGYVVKPDGPEAIRAAIRLVMAGEIALSPTAAALLPQGPYMTDLDAPGD